MLLLQNFMISSLVFHICVEKPTQGVALALDTWLGIDRHMAFSNTIKIFYTSTMATDVLSSNN